MRIVVVFFLMGLIQPVLAITKCEQNGKVLYKKGTCPENSSTKYLVKDKFVAEDHLQLHQQDRTTQSEQSFKDINTPRRYPDEVELMETENLPLKTVKPEKVRMSNETTHFQLQTVESAKDKEVIKNVPDKYDGVNVKLSEMQKKLEQRNQELQQLQQQ